MSQDPLYLAHTLFANAKHCQAAKQFDYLALGPTQSRLLLAVLDDPGIPQATLANRLRIHKSRVSRHLSCLEFSMYVVRRHGPGDQRAKLVFPTNLAKALRRFMESTGQDLSNRLAQGLGTEDRQRIMGDLAMLHRNLFRDVNSLFG